jgi:ribosomal subunit interface protein
MKFQYSEKKVKLPANVHAYAEKKVMKLARYFEEDAEALVVFSVEKNRNNVELTVHGAGTWFRASESTSDMFASIDAAVGTIEGQIRKNKTRLARRLRQDAFSRTVQEETSFAPEQAEDDLTFETVLKDLEEWDSLSVMATMAFLDKSFGVKTTMADYVNMNTIEDIAVKAGL